MTDQLTDSQLQALNQLRDLTNGADDQVAIGVLESVDWDVERAADLIFGTGTSSSATTRNKPRPRFESLEIDDSSVALPASVYGSANLNFNREQQGRPPQPPGTPVTATILSLLSYPLHILSSVFRFVFSILRIPVPHIPLLSFNLHSWWYLGRRPVVTRSGPSDRHRWVRELEEETGAVCIGRSRASGVASGLDSTGAGPSTLTSRAAATRQEDHSQKYLPDFTFGTYEETLRTAQNECRVACIILVSEEHDDTPEFKRSTLTNPALLDLLAGDPSDPHSSFIVWGGDVCSDPEAYGAAEKVGITAFPSIAFVAMQPVRGIRANGSANGQRQQQAVLTVLSRHQGLESVRAEVVIEHLNNSLIPRVIPYLGSLAESQRQAEQERAVEQSRLENERRLRQQQDRAFEDSARRDKERILRKMQEESLAQEEKRKEEALRQQEREQEERKAEELRQMERERIQWRDWIRKSLLGNRETDGRGDLRVAIRLANGTRLVHKFDRSNDTLTTLYAVVDQSLPALNPSSSAQAPASSLAEVETKVGSLVQSHAELWGFELYNAYPRTRIPWAPNIKIGEVEGLTKGGQVVVEILDNGRSESKRAKSEDGYDTESEEE